MHCGVLWCSAPSIIGSCRWVLVAGGRSVSYVCTYGSVITGQVVVVGCHLGRVSAGDGSNPLVKSIEKWEKTKNGKIRPRKLRCVRVGRVGGGGEEGVRLSGSALSHLSQHLILGSAIWQSHHCCASPPSGCTLYCMYSTTQSDVHPTADLAIRIILYYYTTPSGLQYISYTSYISYSTSLYTVYTGDTPFRNAICTLAPLIICGGHFVVPLRGGPSTENDISTAFINAVDDACVHLSITYRW
jgi:hypothetical protein